MKLDNYDLKLLAQIQVDLRTSIDTLSEIIGLSTASIQRRLKRLRDNNVIAAEIAVVSPRAVGQLMTFIISVELERDNVESLRKFKNKVENEPRIQQCYYVTGESDFILIVCSKNMETFDRFTQELFFDESNVRRYKTSVVMERTKVGMELDLS